MNDWQDRQRRGLFFTWTAQRGIRGLEICEARGARFRVADRGWFWDLESQVYNVNVGHCHPHIQDRMIEQVRTLPAASPHAVLPVRARLAELLHRHTGFEKAFLTTGGSEAVENAIKIARLVTGRSKIVTRKSSYHGATLTVLGVAGDQRREPFARDLAPAIHIDDPYPPRPVIGDRPSDWVESLEQVFDREGADTIAAIVLEGLTGTNGMQIPPTDFWPRVRALCDAHGVLLVDDEIFAGFGRTGRWFAHEHWGVRPDMMTIGKGLTSGYAPLAGVLVDNRIAEYFADEKLWCGLTHYAHPVSCAAAIGSIEVLDREGLVANADRQGRRLQDRIDATRRRCDAIVDVRGRGLMMLIELDRPADRLAALLLERGAYVPYRDRWLFVCPPLCLSDDDTDAIADLLESGILDFVSAT